MTAGTDRLPGFLSRPHVRGRVCSGCGRLVPRLAQSYCPPCYQRWWQQSRAALQIIEAGTFARDAARIVGRPQQAPLGVVKAERVALIERVDAGIRRLGTLLTDGSRVSAHLVLTPERVVVAETGPVAKRDAGAGDR